MRLRGGEVWRATHTPQGPATLHLVMADGVVDVDAWGPGAAWAAENAPALCGEEDDDSGFLPREPALADAKRRHPGLRIPKTRAVFEVLVPTVIGQKVATDAAHESYRKLVYELGTVAPGPANLRVAPPAAVLAGTPYWAFHRFGIERRRADVIIRAAVSARGDYHMPHMVGNAFDGTARSTDERMLEILEPFRPHRARVLRLLLLMGASAPRFGPRMPLRDIARS
ncbi:MAG: hypothetical protein AUI15_18375 [Actinobacteria bacterium 13_2_20CM_2_66_6]|nr:MAG: hypothetical protein AUI15_18375 [Actinobacteria bacterium 13_2_20CM_2_66_6]